MLPKSHRSVAHPDEMILTWLCSRTRGESGPRRRAGTRGFSHFPKSTRNRERQAMSDGIRPERENSGGQWFLNHRRGWTRSVSSPAPQSRPRRTNRSRVSGDGATLKSLGCLSGAGRLFGRWLTAVLWSYLLFLRNAGSHRMMCNVYFMHLLWNRGKTRRYSFIYFSSCVQRWNLKIYSASLYSSVQRGLLLKIIHL